MAKDLIVEAESREVKGKSNVRKLRNDGRLPGVIYGTEVSRMLTVDRIDLLKLLHAHGRHPLVTVKVDGDDYLALVKDLQIDPVRQQALHVDFYQVDENKPVVSEVALHVVGEPAGVKEGGILQTALNAVEIEALPRALPEYLDVDVSHLGIGDAVRVSDVEPPEGVRILADETLTVASVVAPTIEEEEAPALTEEELAVLAELTPEELADLQEAAEELEEMVEEAEEAPEEEGAEPEEGAAPEEE